MSLSDPDAMQRRREAYLSNPALAFDDPCAERIKTLEAKVERYWRALEDAERNDEACTGEGEDALTRLRAFMDKERTTLEEA
jgi:hypothetical protein